MNLLRRRIQTAMQSGGGAAAWTPASIAGLQLWLDASQIVGLNDGDAVATWADASGNGNDLTQGTASQRPSYETSELNGLPIVRFDGVDDILINASALSGLSNCSIFVVMKWSAGGASEDLPVCVGTSGVGGKVRAIYRGASATTLGFACWGPDIASSTVNLDIGGAFHVFSAVQSGADVSLGRDGVSSDYTLASTPSATVAGASVGGISPSVGYYTTADIAEVIIYNTVISSGNRSALQAYLAAKYGL